MKNLFSKENQNKKLVHGLIVHVGIIIILALLLNFFGDAIISFFLRMHGM